jgi:hypothetical protein
MNVDDALHELAAARHGFLTRCDARVAGISKKALIRRIERGDWETTDGESFAEPVRRGRGRAR